MEHVLSALAPYGVTGEPQLLQALAFTMLTFGVLAFVALQYTTAPYGKYQTGAAWYYGFPVDAKAAWVLQECPSFLVAAYLWYAGAQDPALAAVLTTVNQTTILLGMYLFHYFNRSFVYPLRIQGGKPTPFVVMMMAVAFCLANGCVQGRARARTGAKTVQARLGTCA